MVFNIITDLVQNTNSHQKNSKYIEKMLKKPRSVKGSNTLDARYNAKMTDYLPDSSLSQF